MNLRHRYEELRGQVLEGIPSGCRMGLALMLREGMAGWIEGWAAAEAPETVSCSPGSASPTFPLQDGRGELVAVLAAMALGTVRGRA
jgi:hypothetical protein